MKRIFKKNIASIFNGYDLKEVLNEVNLLPKDKRIIFFKEYTISFKPEIITDLKEIERKINYRTVAKIKKNIDKTKGNQKEKNIEYKNFFTLFEGFDKKDIINVVLSLNKKDRLLLYKKYGEDLTNTKIKEDLTEEERKDINTRILKVIKNRLRLIKTTHSIITYKDIFGNISLDLLKERLNKLSETKKKRIIPLFGEDLTEYVFISNINKERLIKSEAYEELMGIKKKKEKSFSPFLDSFKKVRKPNETDEELLERIKTVTSKEDIKKLKKKYGEDLNSPCKCSELTKKEKIEINNIILMIKYNLNKKEENSFNKPLFKSISPLYPYRELLIWYNNLEPKEQEILKKKYSENLLDVTNYVLTEEETEILKSLIKTLNNEIIIQEQNKSGIKKTILKKLKILINTKEYRILQRKYGSHKALSVLMNRYLNYYCSIEEISELTDVDISVITALTLEHLMSDDDSRESFYEIRKNLKLKI